MKYKVRFFQPIAWFGSDKPNPWNFPANELRLEADGLYIRNVPQVAFTRLGYPVHFPKNTTLYGNEQKQVLTGTYLLPDVAEPIFFIVELVQDWED